MSVSILIGDCRERMKELPDASVDSVVCDPPYHLTSIVKRFGSENAAPAKVGKTGAYARASKGFMGQTWDGGDVAFDPDTWAEVMRVLKPGGHLIAFSGTRTYHRMAVAIEDAGFEIRDQLAWIYGSGFPKSHDVAKGIDKAAGKLVAQSVGFNVAGKSSGLGTIQRPELRSDHPDYERYTAATDAAQQWQGWGTALKPSWEPICLARKPLIGSVASNVLTHGTGALNIDGCRIEHGDDVDLEAVQRQQSQPVSGFNMAASKHGVEVPMYKPLGRWPANLCHDGSDEVLAGFPESESRVAASVNRSNGVLKHGGSNARPSHGTEIRTTELEGYSDSGSAARFFYCAKATTEERGEGNNHPTVKPQALMRWLVRLITPPGGTVLDPFMGSGSTGLAADAEQFDFIGCEMSPEYAAIAERRMRDAAGMFADVKVAA